MSRRLRYQVAVSLDGYIARKDGSYDWIVMDPSIDFERMYGEFDAAVMGRKTYDVIRGHEHEEMMGGMRCVVFSRTLPPQDEPALQVTSEDPATVVRALKEQPGKDIWLYGGGDLFGTLLKAGLVDTVEVAVIPVLLGEGIPLLPPGGETKLVLTDSKVLPESGILCLAYTVPGGAGPAPTIFYVTRA